MNAQSLVGQHTSNPDIALVVQSKSTIPPAVRAGIVAMVRASSAASHDQNTIRQDESASLICCRTASRLQK